VVNQHNLAYLAALFPESELVREQLFTRRHRSKQHMPPTPSITDPSFVDMAFQNPPRNSRNFGSLLSTDVINSQKDQVLFLLVLVSCCMCARCFCLRLNRKRERERERERGGLSEKLHNLWLVSVNRSSE